MYRVRVRDAVRYRLVQYGTRSGEGEETRMGEGCGVVWCGVVTRGERVRDPRLDDEPLKNLGPFMRPDRDRPMKAELILVN
jgi:hypothetical protein